MGERDGSTQTEGLLDDVSMSGDKLCMPPCCGYMLFQAVHYST